MNAKTVGKVFDLGLAFCLGGIVDSIIKNYKIKKRIIYKITVRTSDREVYNGVLQYLCTASIAKEIIEQQTKLPDPLNGNESFEIDIKSNNNAVIAKIQAEFGRLIGGTDQ